MYKRQIVLSIALVVQFVPEWQFDRILTFSEELETGEISGRGDLWRAAIEIWLNSPLNSIIGIGIGGFGMEVGIVAHNTFLSVLSETGLFGFLLYMSVIVSLVIATLRSHREVRFLLLTLLMVWVTGALSLTWENSKLTWLVWSLVVCIAYGFPRHQLKSRGRGRRRRSNRKTG